MTDELPPFPRAGPYKTLTAQCHCKSTHFTVKVPTSDLPLSVYLCHCSICRYTHGTLCSFQTPLPYGVEPDFVSPSSVESSLTGYMHEEATFERFFCTTCGCHIGERGLREDPSTGLDDWCVTSSIFDTHDEDTFRILSHNFPNPTTEPNLATWLPSVNGRTIHPWNPYPSDPRSALAHARPPEPDLPDRNRLLAQCHCGGVRFTLPRPSEAEAAHPFLSRYLRTGPTPSSAPPNPDTTDNATSTTSTTTTNPATDSAHAHTPATGPPTLKRLACLCLCTSCRLTSGTHAVASTYAPLHARVL
ncbi:uncharacterized protein B0H64DRAFT_436709 [Chaetomium fimeti]|uniref:CENP-V/GFA domain-containing protein n=1 Tax=Chaetomium fimeti TaxID=1854472 RepID=A0AAE0H5R3_9PEZI|nr:hypothetical protein B0H64DRAFT_436709 [Chaetomium fimeti]